VLTSTDNLAAMGHMDLRPKEGGRPPRPGAGPSRVPLLEFFGSKHGAKIWVADFGLCREVAKSAVTSVRVANGHPGQVNASHAKIESLGSLGMEATVELGSCVPVTPTWSPNAASGAQH
jgi:hypothetical protein